MAALSKLYRGEALLVASLNREKEADAETVRVVSSRGS